MQCIRAALTYACVSMLSGVLLPLSVYLFRHRAIVLSGDFVLLVLHSTAFAAGDTETFGGAQIGIAGFITSGTQQLNFFVPLPKSLANISTITCSRFRGAIRGTSGYVNNASDGTTDWTSVSGMTVAVQKSGSNMVRITLNSTSAFTNVTNNTPLHAFVFVILNFS